MRSTSLARRHSAAKPQPRKLKGAGSTLSALPARAISTKIKHLLVILRSQPAVSRRLFRCLRAHLLRSPSTVNPRQTHATCLIATGGHTPPAENLGSPSSKSVLASRTSARCRVLSHSPCRSFRSLVAVSLVHRGKQKAPLTIGKQGWKIVVLCGRFIPAYLCRPGRGLCPWP